MSHTPKPHKAKHKMGKKWQASAEKVAAAIPGAHAGDENDGVQRMHDAIADAPQNPKDRALAAADAFADSSVHFAALVRSTSSTPDEIIAGSKHLLTETLSHMDDVIVPAIMTGVPAA